MQAGIRTLGGVKLLAPDVLLKTGPVDHADWNFRPFLGQIQRRRFHLIRSLLPREPVGRLLEIGYGSGIFLPELAQHCKELHGIDVHESHAQIMEMLARFGITARLQRAGAEALPFDDGHFDCIVAVSSLEFVPDIAAAARELARVLSPKGKLVMVMPGYSKVLDFGLRILTGESARDDYGDRREALLPTLLTSLVVDRTRSFPPFAGSLGMYRALALGKA
jgi:SAM-dependent methyltransferase